MSACNEYVEFACRITLETGAPPYLLLPILRRLRRLATRHERLCETACNGCRTCHGMGRMDADRRPSEAPEARPCPGCSTDTVEAAIQAECDKLTAMRGAHSPTWAIDAVLKLRDELRLDDGIASGRVLAVDRAFRKLRDAAPRSGGRFIAEFQRDPRGATVRIQVPSGASAEWGGIVVPTARR